MANDTSSDTFAKRRGRTVERRTIARSTPLSRHAAVLAIGMAMLTASFVSPEQHTTPPSRLVSLLRLVEEEHSGSGNIEIALANLSCAQDLPGSDGLNVDAPLAA